MNEAWLAPGAIIGALTAVGTVVGIVFSRRNHSDTLLLSSRDEHIEDLRQDLRDTRDRLDKLDQTVQEQGEQIRHLQAQEWSLKRYIAILIDRIRALGSEPPEPPPSINL